MLKLSQAQYRVLEADTKKRWRERLMTWLRKHAEVARGMDDSALHALMERQHQCAAIYGITSERGIGEWCYLALTRGEQFHQRPQIDAFLRNAVNGSPDERIDSLLGSYDEIAGGAEP